MEATSEVQLELEPKRSRRIAKGFDGVKRRNMRIFYHVPSGSPPCRAMIAATRHAPWAKCESDMSRRSYRELFLKVPRRSAMTHAMTAVTARRSSPRSCLSRGSA